MSWALGGFLRGKEGIIVMAKAQSWSCSVNPLAASSNPLGSNMVALCPLT